MDFIVNKDENTMTIKREFAADRQLVWSCYTESDLLDQWFAPSPLTTKTKEMEFREGGCWVYVMIDPDGNEYWARMDYLEIHPMDGYRCLDGFCDENGALNSDLPRASWDVSFHDRGELTLVKTIVTYDSLEDLETIIQMGMKDGLTSALENLDALLLTLTK